MAGPRPDDPYTGPNPSVSPTTETPDDLLSVHATPEDFGAQVGQAFQQAGEKASEATQKGNELAVQYQGMLNETMATTAENQASKLTGQIHGDFMTLQGMDAVAARDSTINNLQDAYLQTKKTLPSMAAQNMFATMTARWQNSLIQDVVDHAAQQGKQAFITAHQASAQNFSDQAGNLAIPFGDIKQGILFEVGTYLQAQGAFSPAAGVKLGANGFTYADNEDGKKAQAMVEADVSKYLGEAAKKRVMALLNDGNKGNALVAQAWYDQNKDDIPGAARPEIQTYLRAPVRMERAKTFADQANFDAHQAWQDSFNKPGAYTTQQIGRAVFGTETHYGANVHDTPQGAKGLYQITDDLWKGYAQKGDVRGDEASETRVFNRIMDHYSKEYNGDAERMMVAYYSGEGNVRPLGEAGPAWIKDISTDKKGRPVQPVSEYVSTTMDKLIGTQVGYTSEADYYSKNYAAIVDAAGKKYADTDPGDVEGYDLVRRLTGEHMTNVITAQDRAVQVDNHKILAAIHGQFNNGVPLTSMSQLLSNPELRDTYYRLNMENPYAVSRIPDLLAANVRKSSGLGSGYWQLYTQIMQGKFDDPMQLVEGGYITGDKNALLTPQGFQQLSQAIDDMKDPTKNAEQQQIFNFLNSPAVKGKIDPGAGGPAGDKLFNQFLEQTLPQIAAGRGAGKSLGELLGPKSDIITNMSHFIRSDTQMLDDAYKSAMAATTATGFNPATIKDEAGLMAAVKNKSISKKDFIATAARLGLTRDVSPSNAPSIPTPQPDTRLGVPTVDVNKIKHLDQQYQSRNGSVHASPIPDEEGLKARFGRAMIDDYDFGRLRDTNPVAYLGFLQGGTANIGEFKRDDLTALGMTLTGVNKPPNLQNPNLEQLAVDEDQYQIIKSVLDEAGFKPDSPAGTILLGPQFAKGQNTNTLEHELMHRGMNYLAAHDPAFAKKYHEVVNDQHILISAFEDYYGYDKNTHDLEMDHLQVYDDNAKPKLSKAQLTELASDWKDEVDALQAEAKKYFK